MTLQDRRVNMKATVHGAIGEESCQKSTVYDAKGKEGGVQATIMAPYDK